MMHGVIFRQGSNTAISYHPQQAFDYINYYKQPSLMQRQRRSWKNKSTPKLPVSPPRPHSDHFLFADTSPQGTHVSIVFPPSKDPSLSRIKLCDIKPSGVSFTHSLDPLVTTSKTPLNVSSTNNDGNVKDGDGNKTQQDRLDIGTPPSQLVDNTGHKKVNQYRHQQEQEHHSPYYQQNRFNSNQICKTQSTGGHRRFPLSENHDYHTFYHNNNQQQQHHYNYPSLPYYLPVAPYGSHPPPPPYYYYYQQQWQSQRQPYSVITYDYQYHQYMDQEDDKQQRRTSTSTRSSSSGITPRRFSSGSSISSFKSTLGSSLESTFTDNNDTTSDTTITETMTPAAVTEGIDQQQQQQQQQQESHDTSAPPVAEISPSVSDNTSGSSTEHVDHSYIGMTKTDKDTMITDSTTIDDQDTVIQANMSPINSEHVSAPSLLDSTDTNNNTLPIWADPIKVRENPTRFKVIQDYMAQHHLAYNSPLPLEHNIVFYISGDSTKMTVSNYRSSMHPLFTCHNVWEFSSRWRRCKDQGKPSQMALGQNIYCFHQGVEPMWEDKVNKNGGRLTLIARGLVLDDLFDWMLCALVGGNVPGMVGLVLSKRARADRIELWLDESCTHSDTVASLR
ncbi:hypothetical protein BC941DRAFT_16693 [Chlamydoabsidia padenii]|nr:hypothetical protein BC941DRAFT_16693 [Chlamydoabsidia padenii]